MFIEAADNNGAKYLRLVESVRVTKEDGSRVTRKKTIFNIGPLAKFTDGKPDYLERLKASFAACTPLIPELLPYVDKKTLFEKYTFQISEGSPECVGHPKLYAHCLLERILEEIGFNSVVTSYKNFSKMEYDILGYLRLMIFGRILNPASKIATVKQNDDYYEPLTKDPYPYHVYDALDFVAAHKKQIFNRINAAIVKKCNRQANVIYYDVTNLYFEIERPDEDTLDEQGNVIARGIRKMGVSKENRNQPITQMGLFMDEDGLPISYEMFPGNTLDHLTVREALKDSVDNMNFGRFIFVGDRGMCSYQNLLHILGRGNGYVVSKSIAKSQDSEKRWLYDDSDYIVESNNFKYKSRVAVKQVKDENGCLHKINEKVVAYWDRRFYEREMAENKRFLEFLERLIETPGNFRVTATQSQNVRRFLKNEYINVDSGEMLQASALRGMVDRDKVEAYKARMGYYQIVTSELNLSEKEIIEIYHGLSRIEDQFRVMKGDLDTRPVYVSTPEHIDAHLAICTIALIVMRILQKRIADSMRLTEGAKAKGARNWTYGLTAERIQSALNKWTVDRLPNEFYRFNDTDDRDLALILRAFDITIPPKLFRRSELKGIKTRISLSS